MTFAADLGWDLGFADFKATVAWIDYEELRWADCDLSPYAGTACGNDITSETSELELQLTSNGAGNLEWVIGAFFLQEELANAFLWYDIASTVDNVPVTPADLNAYASWANQIRVDTTSTAVYGQASYAINDTTRLVGGIRYTDDERDWKIYGQDATDLSRINFSVLEVPDGNGAWDKVTWKAGVEHDVNENSMVYATVSTGFLAGNQQGAFNGTDSYDEQTVTAYELGSKNVLMDRRLVINAAFYVNHFEDLLATRFVDAGATTLAFTDNAGEVEAVGLELEIDWLPNERLQLGALIAIQDASYGDFVLPNVFQEGGRTINDVDNLFQLDGLQVQHSPDFTVTLLGAYTFDLGATGKLIPGVTLYYSDDYRVDDSPWFFGNQGAYTKTDLSLAWWSSTEAWSLRAFINNLEDEATLLKATRFGGDVAITDYAAPRTFGVTFRYQY